MMTNVLYQEKNNKGYITELGVLNAIRQLTDKIIDTGIDYTHILGISRGGLVPAVYLSHSLNLPLAITSYSAIEGKGDGTKNKFTWQDDKHIVIDKSSVVLVVDDIIDSGFTMKHVLEELKIHTAQVDYAVLYEKESSVPMTYCYGYVGKFLEEDSPWIVFPWEIT